MIGKTISHYKIVAKLGEGGMGEVYRAEDLDLDRTVALKFLKHATLPDDAERVRFQREAQAAASLDHPNICTIYEIGQTEDAVFIAMAYVEGSDLNEWIDSGPLPLGRAVDIGTQAAEGLQAAHEKGIIHRDIKSANMIVTDDGRVKITDFGLALQEGQSRLTRSGVTVGTSAFMSPEQCRGESVDERSDIWALGVVIYEMIAGRLPFVASHTSAVMYAILNTNPEPLTAVRSNVPMELERIVDKALAKDSAERYQHADELAADLKRLDREMESSTSNKAIVAGGRARARLRKPAPWIALAAVAAVVAALILFYPSQTVPFTERGWIIVADFDNETGDEVFDGIVGEALSIDLQQSKYVNVFPRQRIDQTLLRMGREGVETVDEATAIEVAQREGVSAVLAGKVNQVGPSYVLTARIVMPATGDAVRTVRAEAKSSADVLAAIDDLSRQVRRDLGESLASIWRHDKPLESVTTTSLQALRYYSMAANEIAAAHWDDAAPLLNQAIEVDSSFAMAYSKLAVIYSNMGYYAKAVDYADMARERAERVTDRERYYIDARFFENRGERDLAIESYKLLVKMYPDDYHGQNNLSFRLQYKYDYDEALEHALAAVRIDPSAWSAHHNLSGIYAGLGQYDLALERARNAQSINPEGYWSYIEVAWVHACQGDREAAYAELDRLPSDDENWQSLKLLYLAGLERSYGRDAAASVHLRQGIAIDQPSQRVSAEAWKWILVADIERSRGNLERSVEALERARRLATPIGHMVIHGSGYAAAGKWAEADSILVELEEPWDRTKTQIDHAWINRYKGELAMVRGDYDTAVDFLERSAVLFEDLATRYRLGKALRLAGRQDRAIAEFEMIDSKRYGAFFKSEPWIWPLSLYEMGLAHQAAGNRQAAVASFDRFLELWRDADPDRHEVLDARRRLEELR